MCLRNEKKIPKKEKEKDYFIGYCAQELSTEGIKGLYYSHKNPIRIGQKAKAYPFKSEDYGFYGCISIIPAILNAKSYAREERCCTIVAKCKFEGLIAKGKAYTGLSDKADSYTAYRCMYRTIEEVVKIYGQKNLKSTRNETVNNILDKFR